VIEPTPEMRRAAYDAMPPEVRIAPAALDEVLAAVLAKLAETRCMERRGHVWSPSSKGAPRSPYDPLTDRERCPGCEDPLEWHGPRGCDGDFGHCTCTGLAP
jgi:hypothetical protein